MMNKENYTDQILDRLDKIETFMDRIQKEEQERKNKEKRERNLSFGAQYAKEYSKKFE